jgi:hypothetical protein
MRAGQVNVNKDVAKENNAGKVCNLCRETEKWIQFYGQVQMNLKLSNQSLWFHKKKA